MTETDPLPAGITRRELLQRGAKIGGAVWAIPVVQAVGMSPAEARGYGPSPGGRRSSSRGSNGSDKNGSDHQGSDR